MAGISEDVGKYLAEVIESASGKIIKEASEHAPVIMKTLLSPERTFENAGPAAKDLWAVHKTQFVPKQNQIESAIAKAAKDPTAPMHPTIHPIMAALIAEHGAAIPTGAIHKAAMEAASTQVYGPNRFLIQGVLKHIAKDNMNQADMISDDFHVMFKEEIPERGGYTQFSKDMAIKRGEEPGYVTPKSPYTGRDKYGVEKGSRFIRRTLTYGAAPVHAAAAGVNMAIEYGRWNTFKSAMEIFGPGEAEANLLASNSIAELYIAPMREREQSDAGLLHKFMPGSVGAWLHANIMFAPGLNYTRRKSIEVAANLGKRMAEEAAERLQKGDTKYALTAFKKLDIDPAKVIEQGYKLAPEDIQKAYYHGANNTVFLDPTDNTPTFWRQSPWFRGVRAFSSFISKESEYLRAKLMDHVRRGDFIGLARTMSKLSLDVPLIGATLLEFDRIRHGEDKGHRMQSWADRAETSIPGQLFDRATGRKAKPISKSMYNQIYLMAEIGAWGNTTGYLRGANRQNLLERAAPPEVRLGAQYIGDIARATKYDSRHKDAVKPLLRDTLSDIPSLGAGTLASHMIFPTKAELAKNKPHRPRRSRNPKKDPNSWDPRDFNPDLDF
jgi:hypothetical protein